MTQDSNERLRRWRLILGGGEADGTGITLTGSTLAMDNALSTLYDGDRRGGLGSSAPGVARWLGDIRTYFGKAVVQIMQKDALERLDLKQMLMEPELLELVEPDVHLVATLLALKNVLPNQTKSSARLVVRKVVEELERRLNEPLRQAVRGSLNRTIRNRRPRHGEIDWLRTIRANLKHYQPEYGTVIPERLVGYGHRQASLRHIILCVDQSGSMATSVVYAGVFGAALASLRALRTHVVVFDTSVVDLSHLLDDPVEILFGTQLGGGTDINRALGYCQTLIEQPEDTILVLLSDLYEGGNAQEMIHRTRQLVHAGVSVIGLLALNDDGAPSYRHDVAAKLAGIGVSAFACTPDLFPDLMAAAIQRRDLAGWAATNEIHIVR
jgi:Mg-chelatase subunit ChlD